MRRKTLSRCVRYLRESIKRFSRVAAVFFFRSKSYAVFGIPSGLTLDNGHQLDIYPPTFGLLTIENGVATKMGGNLTQDGRLMTKYLYSTDGKLPHEHDLFRFSTSRFFPKIFRSKEPVVTLSTSWQANLYHWFFEVLPRLHLAQKGHVELTRIYVEAFLPFQMQSLALLKVNERIINAKDYDAVFSPRLIVPAIPSEPTQWSCAFLREAFLAEARSVQTKKRLYISRAYAASRRVKNEGDVEALLKTHGFEVVVMERLSFVEQITLFRHAEMIIAPHGAALSHLVFCDPQTRVLECFSSHYVNMCYEKLAQIQSLDYQKYTDYNSPSGKDPDIFIDLKKISEFLI